MTSRRCGPDDVLTVARRHGTTVAAEWSGWTPYRVLAMRQRVDGYDRGRGRPSRAEMDAARPKMRCGCGFCRDHYVSPTVTGAEIAARWPSVRLSGEALMANDRCFYALAAAVFGEGCSDDVRRAGRRLMVETMGPTESEMAA